MKIIINIISAIVILVVCLLLADHGIFQIAVNGNTLIDLVSMAIFIFIVYFFVTIKSWSPNAQKEIKIAIAVYCCVNVYIVQTNFGIMCIKRSRYSTRTKTCWSNIRVIQGAVEMYNMDVATMAKTLDIPELIKGKYLRSEPLLPEKDCYYDSYGDLSQDGFVYCTRHLIPSIDEEVINQFKTGQYTPNDSISQEMIDKIRLIKADIESKKSFSEKIQISWKENWPKIRDILYPFLVVFFPFSLHPLR